MALPDPKAPSPRELMAKVVGTTEATPRQFRRKGLLDQESPLIPEEMLDRSHKEKTEIADYYTTYSGEYYDKGEFGYDYANLAGTVDPRTGELIPGTAQAPALHAESSTETQAAPMSLIPTSTINPERPRTTAAGYDPKRKVLTVVFRDGTLYNYYDVKPTTWGNFARAISKGRNIKKFLDGHRRGPASTFGMPEGHRQALYRAARTAQWRAKGIQRKEHAGKASWRRRAMVKGSKKKETERIARYNAARRSSRAAASRTY